MLAGEHQDIVGDARTGTALTPGFVHFLNFIIRNAGHRSSCGWSVWSS